MLTLSLTKIADSEFSQGGTLDLWPVLEGAEPAALALMPIKSFHDLQVWQLSMQLAADVYRLVQLIPSEERDGLSLQLRRASISIPSNIAEGAGYGASRRNIYHVRIALGSDLELQTQLMLIERLRLATPDQVRPLLERASEVGRMLNGLIKSLERHRAASNP